MLTPIQVRDRRHIWHPFTQEQQAPPAIPILRAQGTSLYDEAGNRYLDMVSSWWVNLHGHANPAIAEAITKQAAELEHTMFAGFTHSPAVMLAEQLYALLPPSLSRFFFSDNGSTAVEIAIKLAFQYWYNQGRRQGIQIKRSQLLAFQGGYHGDTFGAMAVGKTSGLYVPFEASLFAVHFLEYPATWRGDTEVEAKEARALDALDQYLRQYGAETAAFIAEPLVQGASGMRLCRPEFMRAVVERLRGYGILIILDEVMTGFGRTGTLFATEQIGSTPDMAPDLLCLSKGLTGGFLPMGLTVATETLYEAFLDEGTDYAFLHGHSYTGNPLGCAAALASLALFETEQTLGKIRTIEQWHQQHLPALAAAHPAISAPRICGTIAAFTYPHHAHASRMKTEALKRGLVIRPIGCAVYLLPPYCITETELTYCYEQLGEICRLIG